MDHLRGVGVLVVVPGHDLNLIGVVVATLNFHTFFVVVHNFETTVTVPQHTVVVPKPACSYHDYITFQRHLQGFRQFYIRSAFFSYLKVYFHGTYSSERPGPGAPPGGVCSAQMRSSDVSFVKISPEVILRLRVRNGCILFDMKQLFH